MTSTCKATPEVNEENGAELPNQFNALFGHAAQGHVSAPGRVNLIGEHTDYNNGFVLPAALNFRTHALFSKRDDAMFEVRSLNYPDEIEQFSIGNEITPGDSHWGNYIRAIAFVLKRAGYEFSGLNLLIDSNVPQGAGLSSSAALEVSVAGAISEAYGLAIEPQDLALLGQQAENDFMDCQCGIMDQLVSAKGEQRAALLIDCENLQTQAVPVPEALSLVIVNSNYPRKLVGSEYNVRREDCEQAAKVMGVASLRQADMNMLEAHRDQLSDNQFKRARHVITENSRVLQAVEALKTNNFEALQAQMAASHVSMRDDFEITVPAIDGLVEICNQALGGKGAVRMTGGGFGGAIVCLCPKEQVAQLKAGVEANYARQFDLQADFYVCQADAGYSVLTQ